MIHTDRVFGITEVPDVKTLANQLFHYTCTRCSGYQLGEYLFLNDSFSEDSKQEFAVFRITELDYIKIESITISCRNFTEHHLELALTVAMESKLNMGTYGLKLELAECHQCDLCA
jgi:hypothetical protein